jgi:predicted Zn-dependent peptidase
MKTRGKRMTRQTIALITAACLTAVGLAGTGCSTTSKTAQTDDNDGRDSASSQTVKPEETSSKVSKVNEFRLDGLQVLHLPNPTNRVVSAKLYIDGGVTNFSADKAGIEQLALNVAVNGGTDSTPKDAFKSALNSTGSSVSYSTGRDYSSYSLHTVLDHVDKTWQLFAEAVAEPRMPASEIQTQRKQQIASIRQISENPNRLVGYKARKLISGDHPYSNFQHGTVDSVTDLTRKDLVDYHQSLLNPDRMLLVIVGNLSKSQARTKATSLRERLPEADTYNRPEMPKLSGDKRYDFTDKAKPTNYILGTFNTPNPTTEDYPALMLGLEYLSDRFFEEIRTKRNLSYAVAAGLQGHRSAYGYLYVSTQKPQTTLDVMYDEIAALKKEPISEQALKETRNVFITNHYMGMETNAAMAASLAHAELVGGDWRRHFAFMSRYRSVTPEQIHEAVNNYLNGFHFAVVGNKSADKRAIYSR